ncbi:MAG: diguanylate cyclase [Candidatus Sedimenticola sp. PURPLELP]
METSCGILQDNIKLMRDLDKAVIQHFIWIDHIHKLLICSDEDAKPGDLESNAFQQCGFGTWLYSGGKEMLGEYPALDKIEKLHKELHQQASYLVETHRLGNGISTEDFTGFTDLSLSFKIELRNLQFTIVNQICAVDHLTGIWNRQSMTYRLNQEYERVVRTSSRCVICMVDLDHFKQVNDRFGHLVGDDVLRRVTEICRDQLRKYDAIFRFGGEEFLLCLPDTPLENASPLMERLRKMIAEADMGIENGADFRITASFGATEMTKETGPNDAISEADHALLTAKANGRNQVVLWSEDNT